MLPDITSIRSFPGLEGSLNLTVTRSGLGCAVVRALIPIHSATAVIEGRAVRMILIGPLRLMSSPQLLESPRRAGPYGFVQHRILRKTT